jgi:plastocyanin domain-containing protein
MATDQILVTVIGLLLIGGTYWFFFLKPEDSVHAADAIKIVVNGGYSPDTIYVPAGKNVTLTFYRKDPNPCLEEVILTDFGVRRFLPLEQPVAINLLPQKKGRYQFSCGMRMYHGNIVAS